jgi:hypothetical protein
LERASRFEGSTRVSRGASAAVGQTWSTCDVVPRGPRRLPAFVDAETSQLEEAQNGLEQLKV